MLQKPECLDVDIEFKSGYTPLENLFIIVTDCLPERKYNKYDITKWIETLRALQGKRYTIMTFYFGVGCTNKTIQQIADFHQLESTEVEYLIKDSIIILREFNNRYRIQRAFGGPEHFTCA